MLAGDIVLIAASVYLGPILRFGILLDPAAIIDISDIITIVLYILILYIFDFYNLEKRTGKSSFTLRFALAVITINMINVSLFYILHIRPYGSGILAISGSFAFLFLLTWRFAFMYFLDTRKPLKVLILGAGKSGKSLCHVLQSRSDFKMAGFVDDDPEKRDLQIGDYAVLGNTCDLKELVIRHKIDLVIVAATKKRSIEFFQKLVEVKFSGVNVYEMPTFYEEYFEVIPVLHTTNMWLGFADISGVERNIYNTKLKKLFDKAMAIILLVIAFPVMLLTVLLVKLESDGPVFYYQNRVGWDEKIFKVIKFRSMKINAEANGAVWAQENDPRVTRVGKIIRLLRIDELPQLWNVLKGDMSFVGPRPERPEFVESLKKEIPFYSLRHSIRPGITGWAQVNYPYGATVKDALAKLEYDLYYIKNVILPLDLIIIARTVRTVLFGKGAR